MYLVIIGKGEGVDFSGKVGEEKVELSQSLLILKLQMKVLNVLKNGKIVGSIDHKYSRVDLLDWELDMLANRYLH
jgi:hypothetical protein